MILDRHKIQLMKGNLEVKLDHKRSQADACRMQSVTIKRLPRGSLRVGEPLLKIRDFITKRQQLWGNQLQTQKLLLGNRNIHPSQFYPGSTNVLDLTS